MYTPITHTHDHSLTISTESGRVLKLVLWVQISSFGEIWCGNASVQSYLKGDKEMSGQHKHDKCCTLTVYLKYLGEILTVYLKYLGDTLTVYLKCFVNTLTVYLKCLGDTLTVYLKCFVNTLTVYLKCLGIPWLYILNVWGIPWLYI